MNGEDAFDLALQALEELGGDGEITEKQYAFNAIHAFTASGPEKTEPPAPQGEGVDAIYAITPPRLPGGLPAPPDPGARCERHRRLLTFSEQLFGACSWCVWEDRQGEGRSRR